MYTAADVHFKNLCTGLLTQVAVRMRSLNQPLYDVTAILVILTTYMNKVRKFINNMSGHKRGV